MKKIYLLPFLLSFFFPLKAQIIVTPGASAPAIISSLGLNGVTVSNFTVSGPSNAYGTFSNGNTTNIGITDGSVFTTGNASGIIGPNSAGNIATCNGTSASDPHLTITEPTATEDLVVVEFDLVPQCSQLSVRFVFGSEEYPEFVGASYNDVFGFFLSGPGPACQVNYYNNTNVATLPSGIPVSIDNVNATSNSSFYVNNTGGSTIQYDGFTTVLTRTVTVCPCQTYHFKIAIADAGDCYYDSGVLIDFLTCSNALSTSITSTQTTCGLNNGAATVTASGSTGPYTYSWSPAPGGGQSTSTATGLTAGTTYTVTVNDGMACSPALTNTVTITQLSAAMSSTGTQTNVSCNGGTNGSATVIPSGGTSPYTYAWAPSGGTAATATGLSAGTYTVTVTDISSCSTTRSYTIAQPPALVVSPASQTNVSCFGSSNGAASVTASGGTGALSYNWTPGNPTGDGTNSVTGLTAGTWTCTVTDANSCTATSTFNITQAPVITATFTQVNVSCNGACNGSATVTAAGGTPAYTYSWSPSGGTASTATSLCAGTYTCTITDANGCIQTQTVTITQPPVLTASSVSGSILCNGGTTTVTVSASGGAGPYTGTGTFTVSAGTHSYTVTDANGCTATSNITVTQPTALMAMSSATTIMCNGGTADITVTAMDGTGPYTGTGIFTVPAGTYSYTVTDANGCTAVTNITVTQPTALMAMSSATTILCNGGTADITVTAMDGTVPYTGTGTFNVPAGIYNYTVTDANGCTAVTNITVTQPTALMAMSTATTILCNGGTADIDVTAMDGTAPYAGTGTFTVNAGTYSYIVTDTNGCTATTNITVTEPDSVIVSVTSTNSNCGSANGTATVNASGGTGVFTYLWSSTGTAATEINLLAGTYTVTVTDANACSLTETVNVSDIGAPTVNTTSADASCNGSSDGSIDNTVSGGAGAYTYSWSNLETTEDLNTLTAGTYTYTVTDGAGCQASGSVVIVEPAAIDVTTAVNSNMITANSSTGTYQWIDCDNGNMLIPGETGQSFTAVANGNYAVIITDGACSDTSACASIVSIGIDKNSSNTVSIYPNPNTGSFVVESKNKIQVQITDALGRLIYSEILNEGQQAINLNETENGIYLIKLTSSDKEIIRRIVINR